MRRFRFSTCQRAIIALAFGAGWAALPCTSNAVAQEFNDDPIHGESTRDARAWDDLEFEIQVREDQRRESRDRDRGNRPMEERDQRRYHEAGREGLEQRLTALERQVDRLGQQVERLAQRLQSGSHSPPDVRPSRDRSGNEQQTRQPRRPDQPGPNQVARHDRRRSANHEGHDPRSRDQGPDQGVHHPGGHQPGGHQPGGHQPGGHQPG